MCLKMRCMKLRGNKNGKLRVLRDVRRGIPLIPESFKRRLAAAQVFASNTAVPCSINLLWERIRSLGQVRSVLMGMIEGQMEGAMSEASGSLGSGGSAASGDDSDDQVGDVVRLVAGALGEVMRRDSPMPWETGLIASMEREAEEAGAGGWFNGNPEDVPESWSGANSDVSASQDRVGTTLLTTIGG